MSFRILYPEQRTVSGETIISWATDAIANGEADGEGFDGSVESAMYVLDDAGLVTFADDESDDEGEPGLELWARRYDELNGAPESEDDR
jgi:hypothetical protein